MAKPNAPKELKPKEGETEKDTKAKEPKGPPSGLIINVITTILICSIFLLANYFIQDSLLTKKYQAKQQQKKVLTLELKEKTVQRQRQKEE